MQVVITSSNSQRGDTLVKYLHLSQLIPHTTSDPAIVLASSDLDIALIPAITANEDAAMRTLLTQRAVDEMGRTPLQLALQQTCIALAKLLVEAGVCVQPRDECWYRFFFGLAIQEIAIRRTG